MVMAIMAVTPMTAKARAYKASGGNPPVAVGSIDGVGVGEVVC